MISISNETELSFSALHVTDPELYDAMGYGTSTPDEAVLSEIRYQLRRVSDVTIPRFQYLLANGTLSLENDTLQVGNTVFHIGKIIARQLRGAECFAFFTATAGIEFQTFQQQLEDEQDMVNCYLADCIGSVIAEKTADCMEEKLQKEIDKYGWKHTNRFSPGYCGWHVSEQPSLFSLFPSPHPCGIRLTDSSLMFPIKSVSGIIGLGPQVRKLEYTCGLCAYEQCYKRKRRE